MLRTFKKKIKQKFVILNHLRTYQRNILQAKSNI